MYPSGFEHWDSRRGAFRHECAICGEAFYSRRRTGVKFCSAKCRKRSSLGHKSFETEITCKHCGQTGHTSQPFQHKQYCSNACRQAAYRERKRRQ